jgi:hypothetical protein
LRRAADVSDCLYEPRHLVRGEIAEGNDAGEIVLIVGNHHSADLSLADGLPADECMS